MNTTPTPSDIAAALEDAQQQIASLQATLESTQILYGICIKERNNLEQQLEKFTAGGLLDCHMICDQRDKAIKERDALAASYAELKGKLASMNDQAKTRL